MGLAQFMQDAAVKGGYTLHDGAIDITILYQRIRYDAETHRLFPGSVYGLAVNLDRSQKEAFLRQARELRQTRIARAEDWVSVEGDVYPLYWGKEWPSGSRLYAHLGGFSGTNALCLYEQKYPGLEGVPLLYASIRVSPHEEFEAHLNSLYPPLLKTVRGKGPKVCP